MIEISINEANELLMKAYPGLYADLVSGMRDDYTISKSNAYISHGAIIVKTFWYSDIIAWHICDVGNSDMNLARTELTEKSAENLNIIMIHARELEGIHCLIFSCTGISSNGKQYTDSDIHLLSENDRKQFLFVTTVLNDNNEFAKGIANNLVENFSDMSHDSNIQMLGIFNAETLAGVISIKNKHHNEVIVVSNVFIPSNYRGRGYSTRLIKAAMAMYPEVRFWYSCGTDNYQSIAAAKSAGFVFEGTYDFL